MLTKKKRFISFLNFISIGFFLLMIIYSYKIIPYKIAINLSSSQDLGIYLLKLTNDIKYKIDDLVIVCIPNQELARISLERGYLSHGNCPYNTAYEIKNIIAIENDSIKINKKIVYVNNKSTMVIRFIDSKGKVLPSILKETILGVNEYLVTGKTMNSFDSRYYGIVPLNFIMGRAYPIFTWKSL